MSEPQGATAAVEKLGEALDTIKVTEKANEEQKAPGDGKNDLKDEGQTARKENLTIAMKIGQSQSTQDGEKAVDHRDQDQGVSKDAAKADNESSGNIKPKQQRMKSDWKRKGQSMQSHHQRREPKETVSAEKLHQESMDAKRAPAKIFDGFARNRVELAGWLKDNMPSDVKRSDGVGAVVVMAKNRSQEAILTFEEKLERGLKAHEEWLALTQAATKDTPVTFKDVGKLAEKHELRGGKWMFHVNRKDVDSLWRQLAWAVGFDKFPANVISASVTPVDDLGHKSAQDKGIHVISLWNNDFRDDQTLLQTEKVVRRTLNVKMDMIYKPDIYSGIGIYRNNPWKLSPVMYSSKNGNLLTVCGTRIDSGSHLTWTYPVAPRVETVRGDKLTKDKTNKEDLDKGEVAQDVGDKDEVENPKVENTEVEVKKPVVEVERSEGEDAKDVEKAR